MYEMNNIYFFLLLGFRALGSSLLFYNAIIKIMVNLYYIESYLDLFPPMKLGKTYTLMILLQNDYPLKVIHVITRIKTKKRSLRFTNFLLILKRLNQISRTTWILNAVFFKLVAYIRVKIETKNIFKICYWRNFYIISVIHLSVYSLRFFSLDMILIFCVETKKLNEN